MPHWLPCSARFARLRASKREIAMSVPFTIIMPCYNAGLYVREALESVLHQDYEGDLQLIVVDDCSTDNSLEVISSVLAAYQGPVETLLLRNEVNRGVAATVDAAVAHAKHEWIIEADADDIHVPTRCSDTAELINRYPSARLVILSAINVDEHGNPYAHTYYCHGGGESIPEEIYLETTEERALNYAWSGNKPRMSAFAGCSAFHRSIYSMWGDLAVAPYERVAQDPVWELRCVLCAPIVGSRKTACHYRCHSGNLLNRSRQWDTLQAWKDYEIFHARYHQFNKRTYEAMLRDVQRAMETPGLSDWSETQLRTVEEMLHRMCYTARMVVGWWNMNVIHRMLWWCVCRSKVMDNMRPWFRNRLLPFHLACWVRFKLHQRRG